MIDVQKFPNQTISEVNVYEMMYAQQNQHPALFTDSHSSHHAVQLDLQESIVD